ncbi:MAG TPA: hypothetical protein VGD98_02070 [Ktedonobacteraceae bacterium]
MEKFHLDLDTILQNFRQNGILYGDIPARKLGNKVPWKTRIRIVEGHVISCQILDSRDAIVSSAEQALEALRKLGPIDWEVLPDAREETGKLPALKPNKKSGALPELPERVPPSSDSPSSSPVPCRLMNVTLKQMHQTQWPRDYRLVYILIDGIRSSAKIAEMLALPLADVEQILLELQSMRIIDLQP